jgi:hypothetical protein
VKILVPTGNLDLLVVQLVASRYTDYAIPALTILIIQLETSVSWVI